MSERERAESSAVTALREYLLDQVDDVGYFKAHRVADDLDYSPKALGRSFAVLRDGEGEPVAVEAWAQGSRGTCWRVERRDDEGGEGRPVSLPDGGQLVSDLGGAVADLDDLTERQREELRAEFDDLDALCRTLDTACVRIARVSDLTPADAPALKAQLQAAGHWRDVDVATDGGRRVMAVRWPSATETAAVGGPVRPAADDDPGGEDR